MECITEHITRIWIPFKGVKTSAFIVTTTDGVAILDSGASAVDVTRYILPFLAKEQLSPSLLVASHPHNDHAGGIPALATQFPNAKIAFYDDTRLQTYPEERRHNLSDGDLLLGCLRVVHTPGHTPDSICVFDERTRTLLTFDTTQGFGVGRFGSGISDVPRYLASLDRMASLSAEHLVAAHDFLPIGSSAHGHDAVCRYIDGCRQSVAELTAFVANALPLSPEDISKKYVATYPDRPPSHPLGRAKFYQIYRSVIKSAALHAALFRFRVYNLNTSKRLTNVTFSCKI